MPPPSVICALPPPMRWLMTGALKTLSSRTMAMRRFTLRPVSSSKRSAPRVLKRRPTYGALPCVGSNATAASSTSSPVTFALLNT
jgi:hypothetical protein